MQKRRIANSHSQLVWLLLVGSSVGFSAACDDDQVKPDAGTMSEAEAGLADVGPREAGQDSSDDAGPVAADAQTEAGDASILVPPPCMSVAPTSCPDPAPHYADVAPIFERRCVACHNGADGEWPLSMYQHVADWYGEIRAMMLSCGMPPVESGMTMELEERQQILTWIRCGFPR